MEGVYTYIFHYGELEQELNGLRVRVGELEEQVLVHGFAGGRVAGDVLRRQGAEPDRGGLVLRYRPPALHYKVSADYLLGLTDDPEPKYHEKTKG